MGGFSRSRKISSPILVDDTPSPKPATVPKRSRARVYSDDESSDEMVLIPLAEEYDDIPAPTIGGSQDTHRTLISSTSAIGQLALITAAQTFLDPFQDPFDKSFAKRLNRAAVKRSQNQARQAPKQQALSWAQYYDLIDRDGREETGEKLQERREYWEKLCVEQTADLKRLRGEKDKLGAVRMGTFKGAGDNSKANKTPLDRENANFTSNLKQAPQHLDDGVVSAKTLFQQEVQKLQDQNKELRASVASLESGNIAQGQRIKDFEKKNLEHSLFPSDSTMPPRPAIVPFLNKADSTPSFTPSSSKRPRTSSDAGNGSSSPAQDQPKCEELQKIIYQLKGTIETQKSTLEHMQNEQGKLRADMAKGRDEARSVQAELETLKAENEKLRMEADTLKLMREIMEARAA